MNPAVTLANCLTGHTSWGRGGLYMAAQLLGAIFGALIEAGLTSRALLSTCCTVSDPKQSSRLSCIQGCSTAQLALMQRHDECCCKLHCTYSILLLPDAAVVSGLLLNKARRSEVPQVTALRLIF